MTGNETRLWVLPADSTSAAEARRLVRETLSGQPACDDAELVASELAANVVAHAHPPATLRLDVGDAVRITVTSRSGVTEPTAGPAAGAPSGGRGLALVAAVSTEWGWRRDGGLVSVWAELPR